MTKLEKCERFMESYLANCYEDTVSIEVDDNVRYLMAQQYVEGYNAGQSVIISEDINANYNQS